MRVVLTLAVVVFVVPDRPNPMLNEGRPLQEQLQGEWQVAVALVGGKPQPALKPGETVFIFTGDRLAIRRPTLENFYEFTIDASQSPAAINLRSVKIAGKETKGKSQAVPGIVKIEGDMLSICLRPVNGFASDPNTKVILWQAKRVKK